MTSEEKSQVKAQLLKQKEKLNKRILEYKELTAPIAPDDAIGRVSRMDAINNKSVNEAAMRNAEAKLNQINTALDRIDVPEFGVCIKCGASIKIGRLLVMPGSNKCIRCG